MHQKPLTFVKLIFLIPKIRYIKIYKKILIDQYLHAKFRI